MYETSSLRAAVECKKMRRKANARAGGRSQPRYLRQLPLPWTAGIEATTFTVALRPLGRESGTTVKMAHSAMLMAIAAGKKKKGQEDARKLADLPRCD